MRDGPNPKQGANHEWFSTAVSQSSGSGCPKCAKYGYNPGKDGWVYLLHHPDWLLQQIGITNDPETRLARHGASGWEVMELVGPMTGELAYAWEQSILGLLRGQGISGSPSSAGGKFSGFTESWPISKLKVSSVRQLMDLVEAAEQESHRN